MTRELFVWLFNEKVGTLRLEKGRLSFTYTKEYLRSLGQDTRTAPDTLYPQPVPGI